MSMNFRTIQFNKRISISLRLRLIIPVAIETMICILAALGITTFINRVLAVDDEISLIVVLVPFCLIVGTLVTNLLSKGIFAPIKKIEYAISEVANGNFDIQLKEKHSTKEIQDICTGFNLMVKELSANEMMQSDFVSNVSHEFKTPIAAIEGYATLLQNCENLNEEERNYVEKIYFNTRRLSELVGDILLLSKLDNQSIQSNKTDFRLDEQIRQSIVMLEPKWEEKDIEFDAELEDIEYIGNESLLHHVWDNLLENAIKFSPQEGLIRMRLYQENEKVIFTIEDNGPGISEGAKPHIFDKFYQADSSHKEEGTGLGLALVKQIVTLSNGEVEVENMEEGGCRFTVTLKI